MNKTPIQIGTWLSVGSPVIAELAALSGFDWLLFDLEHGSEAEAALPNQLRALNGSPTQAIVRVGAPHPEWIARVLDWGASGIMVPHVQSATEAEAIVKSAYYAPHGQRGLSRTVRAHGYGLDEANTIKAPLIMVQIESVEGVKNVDAIANVERIDVLFVGPADLRHDLEHYPDRSVGDFDQCLDKVVAAAANARKSAGILVREIAAVPAHIDRGFTHIAVDSDLAILRRTYQQILSSGNPSPR